MPHDRGGHRPAAQTPRQTSNNLMIMDAAGSRAWPRSRRTASPSAGRTSTAWSARTTAGARTTPTGRCDRYDSLRAASSRTRAHRRPEAGGDARRRLAGQVHAPVDGLRAIEPVIYLSAQADAARGTFHRLDLKGYFGLRKEDRGRGEKIARSCPALLLSSILILNLSPHCRAPEFVCLPGGLRMLEGPTKVWPARPTCVCRPPDR